MTRRPRALGCLAFRGATGLDASGLDLLATDARRNVIVTAFVPHVGAAVVKLGRNGRERWRRMFRGNPTEVAASRPNALVVAPGGDIVVGGEVGDEDHPGSFAVERFDAKDGHVRWRNVLRFMGQNSSAAAGVVVDAAGDVIAAGTVAGATGRGTDTDFFVAKYAGATGEMVWRMQLDGGVHAADFGEWIKLQPTGDVLVVGEFTTGFRASGSAVGAATALTLGDADGAMHARVELQDGTSLHKVTSGAESSLVVAGYNGGDFSVTKVDAGTGRAAWTASVNAPRRTFDQAFDAVLLASGDVAATGYLGDLDGQPGDIAPSLVAVRFDGATRQERWRRVLTGTAGWGVGRSVAELPGGDVVVVGRVRNVGSCYDVIVLRLAAATGEVVATKLIDGRAQASICDTDPACFPPEGPGVGEDVAFRASAAARRCIGRASDGRSRAAELRVSVTAFAAFRRA